MTDEPIPVAVVGAGNMGANHVRVFDELPGASLVEVVERDDERAEAIGERYDVAVRGDVSDLTEARAAAIAVPNDQHRPVAEACLEAGLDVLVEKPLALNTEDARAIVTAADERDAILQVGHIERFNPAVATLERVLETEEVIAIEAHRLGPFHEHLSEENVLFDLMIHDLDVIEHLVSAPIEHTDAIGVTSRSGGIDHAVAFFKFDDGVVATATASHVTHGKVRRLSVTTARAYIELNYQTQRIEVQRRGHEVTTPLSGSTGYRTETVTETPFVSTREPLKVELEHFLEAVRSRDVPDVDGAAGLRAVELTSVVEDRIGRY